MNTVSTLWSVDLLILPPVIQLFIFAFLICRQIGPPCNRSVFFVALFPSPVPVTLLSKIEHVLITEKPLLEAKCFSDKQMGCISVQTSVSEPLDTRAKRDEARCKRSRPPQRQSSSDCSEVERHPIWSRPPASTQLHSTLLDLFIFPREAHSLNLYV